MANLTQNQRFHLILADIAMAMAISTYDPGYAIAAAEPVPGTLRDRWLEQVTERLLRQRVTALASAGLASLQTLDADALAERAARYGLPMPAELAGEIAGHFVAKRAAVLTYRR